jgi:hypothetical protein
MAPQDFKMLAELFDEFQHFLVGGTFVTMVLYTKKMHANYAERIEKLEKWQEKRATEENKILKTLHELDVKVTRLTTIIDIIYNNGGKRDE